MDHKIKFSIFNFQFLIFLSAFALYSFLAIFAPKEVWNSPDETANAFFIEHLRESGSLAYFDPAVLRSNGLIHPRSMAVRDGMLVPGSFVGMIIFYALPVKLLGLSILPFLTPFFSALALLAFGAILKKFLSPRAAKLSVILALFHPALWYYANRGLFHNAFFLDCVIFSIYFAIVRPLRRANGLLAGAMFFLALSVRTFEAIWFLPLALIWLFLNKKKVNRKVFFVYGILLLGALAAMLFISKTVYGSFLPSGYPRLTLLPFGFSLGNMARNGIWYGRLFFFWYTALAGAGIIYLIYLRIKEKAPKELWYGLLALLGVSLPLFIIYGSGRYLDTPDPAHISIGNSLVRYWLPLYIGSVPFAGWFLDKLAGVFKSIRSQRLFLGAILLAVGLLSFRVVFYGKGEGLVYVIPELKRYKQIRAEVVANTLENAIIISDRSDKIFFPYRHVISGSNNTEVIDALWELNDIGPLYLYSEALEESDPRFTAYQSAGFPLRPHLEFGKERLYFLAPH